MRIEFRFSGIVLVAILSLALLSLAAPALAGDPPSPEATPEPAAETGQTEAEAGTAAEAAESKVVVRRIDGEVPSMRGLVAVRDAETGELRAPNAEEWQRLSASIDPLSRSDAGLVEIHHPDGTVVVRLDGRFHNATVGHRHPETGEVDFTCTHHAQTATDLLTGEAPAAAPEKREVRDDM
ncbi:MAG: hypothetical protein MI919_24760 [Holophagales bacterium]|nr:hypothetical protein [Holophagales bacterium]